MPSALFSRLHPTVSYSICFLARKYEINSLYDNCDFPFFPLKVSKIRESSRIVWSWFCSRKSWAIPNSSQMLVFLLAALSNVFACFNLNFNPKNGSCTFSSSLFRLLGNPQVRAISGLRDLLTPYCPGNLNRTMSPWLYGFVVGPDRQSYCWHLVSERSCAGMLLC